MSDIKVKINEETGKAGIYTPYNPEFVKLIKNIGGARWNGECWVIPATEIDIAREYMLDVYGESDISVGENVTIKITAKETLSKERSDVVFANKVLARAWSRDGGARVGADVTLLEGEIDSGGSRNRWDSVVYEGAVFLLRNVNTKVLEKEDKSKFDVEAVTEQVIDKSALKAEKEKLLKRIAEIDKLLDEHQ